jgi:integrase
VAKPTLSPLGESRNLSAGSLCSVFKGENMPQQTTPKRARGSGSIFQNGSAVWWIGYSERGIKHRENSHSTDYAVAERLLKRRLAENETGVFVPKADVRIDELVADVMAEYSEKQQKSYSSLEQRWRLHLKPYFTKRRAGDITTDLIRRYTQKRRADGASPATINRELAVLKRAFNLAMESTPPKVRTAPYIPMFEERNVRTGFLADQDHARLASECSKIGLWLRAILSVGYNYGWRAGEIVPMRGNQIDLLDRTIRLEVGSTKNGRGRTVKMTQEVYTLLRACAIGKNAGAPLFTRKNGAPVLDFRGAWQGACARAGLGKFICRNCDQVMTKRKCKCGSRRRKYIGLLFHDLRRTGVRNLRRLGVAESVAMKISGHKTPSVFKRYDIVEMADVAEAAARLDAKQESQASSESQFGQTLGRVAEKSTQNSTVADQRSVTAVLPN